MRHPFVLAPFALATLGFSAGLLASPGDALGPGKRLLFGGVKRIAYVAATDAHGNLTALSGTTGQHFAPDGTAIGAPFTIANSPSAMAMDADGDFAIVWRTGLSDQRLWTQCYAADGAPKSDAVQVFASKDVLGDFDIAMDADGDFVVGWDDMVRTVIGPSFGYFGALVINENVRVQRYSNACVAKGKSVSVAYHGGTVANGDIGGTRVAMNASGAFTVAWWASGTGSDGIKSKSYRADGSASSIARTVTAALNVYDPDVAMADDGSSVVVWDGYSPATALYPSVMARVYGPTGFARGAQFVANEPTEDARFGPSVAMAGDGRFVIAWVTNPTPATANDVYARRFAANGTPLAGEFLAPVDPALGQGGGQVFVDPAGFTLLWQGYDATGDGTFVRRFEGP